MLSFEERMKHVSLKLFRAKEHLEKLELEVQEFYKTQPFKVGVKISSETRRPTYFVESATPVPDRISVLAGDLIQNLVTALDRLAYQLVCNDTSDSPPKPNAIYFPIADDLQKYNENKHRKMNGASAETISAIDALKPYKGGNDLIWSLHALNNIEKHRLLLTVGSNAAGIELFHTMSDQMENAFSKEAMSAFKSMGLFLNPADKGFSLVAGFGLYTGAVDEQPKPEMQFRFDIGLNEEGISEEVSLLETLKKYAKEVEKTINQLAQVMQ